MPQRRRRHGRNPTAALVTLGLPAGFQPERIQGIYRGLQRLAVRHQVAVVGGETTTNPGLADQCRPARDGSARQGAVEVGERAGDALL